MFSERIVQTQFSTDAADTIFHNISAGAISRSLVSSVDGSFLSTMRALVAPRMSEGEQVYIKYSSSDYDEETMKGVPVSRAVKAICSDLPESDGGVLVHNLKNHREEANLACIAALNTNFTRVYKGWERVRKVTDFYAKQFHVTCFIHRETRRVAFFVDRLDFAVFHYLQCSIFVAMPWYFNPAVGVSEDEMNLIKSLKGVNKEEYIRCLNKLAEQYDFRTAKIKQLLQGVEKKFAETEIKQLMSDIENCNRRIDDHNNGIKELIRNKRAFNIRLLGLKSSIEGANESSELMNYFLCNQKVELCSVDDTKITFIVKDYFMYFDEECVRAAIDNDSSVIYSDYDECEISAEQMRTLMRAVFVDGILKMRASAAFTYDINGHLSVLQGFDYDSYCIEDYMPNPHLDGYACLGDYSSVINSLMSENNHIGVIEQCVASCKSLDFTDYTVLEHFMDALYGENSCSRYRNCFELPDGTVVGIKAAIEWVENQMLHEAVAELIKEDSNE